MSGTTLDPRSLGERLDALVVDDVRGLVKAESKYGQSWRKRGGCEAFFNLSRKMDRIEVAAAKAGHDIFKAVHMNPAGDGTIGGKDGLLDDIRDLRRYLLLVEDHVLNVEPMEKMIEGIMQRRPPETEQEKIVHGTPPPPSPPARDPLDKNVVADVRNIVEQFRKDKESEQGEPLT